VAFLCYGAAEAKMPTVSRSLFWIAVQVYKWFPALGRLHSPHIPMLVSGAAIGVVIRIIGLACAAPIAAWLSAGQLAGLERQTAKLKRNRARLRKARRERDSFDVE
jgi:hypothetical protein